MVIMVLIIAVVMAVAAVMTPGKGSGENLKKSSLWREGRFFLRFLMRDGACVGVIGIPINILPA